MTSREEVTALIERDPLLRAIATEARARMDGDPGHDFHHALRVAAWTIRIGGDEVDAVNAIVAALLHDVINLPKNSPDRARASELSAELASELMRKHAFSRAAIDDVSAAIRTHSFSRGETPTNTLGRALQDADRLEALGALGVMRTVSCGAQMGAVFFDAEDPWAKARALDDKRFTVDHFFVKLLGLGAAMNTDVGRGEAERRIAFLRSFLDQLGDEIGSGTPFQVTDSRGSRPTASRS